MKSVKKAKAPISWLQMAGMLGMQDMNADEMTGKLEEMLPVIKEVNEQFKDPVSSALGL